MKTLRYSLFFLLIGSSVYSSAQRDTKFTSKNEIGINITSMLVRTLGNQAGFAESDYPITYKRRTKDPNKYLRTGIGINIRQADNTLSLNENILKGDLKVGMEWRKPIGKSFLLTYGIDGFVGFAEDIISNENVELYSQDRKLGAGAFLGLQWLLSDMIALEIESALVGLIGNRLEETRFLTFPGPAETNSQSRYETSLNPPQWLYFVIKF